MKCSLSLVLVLVLYASGQYIPEWESIDSRPIPTWYDQAKIGIFIHWGVYSAPSASNDWFGEEWFEWAWKSGHNYPGDGDTPGPGPGSPKLIEFMAKNYPPGTTYYDLGKDLTAEFWNPDQWVDLFRRAGAKYVVLTSKHHDGYTLWPSQYNEVGFGFPWNSMEVGPKRDIVGELATAVRKTDIRFGLYHSYTEWSNPLWLQDKRNGYNTNDFVVRKTDPELYELVNNYRPDVIWSDGEWAPDSYWRAKEFLAWLYNDSPVKDTVAVNDRWGWDTVERHGGYWTGMDRWNPGELQPHKWENCFTFDKYSWGYRRDNRYEDYMKPEEVISTLVETVSCGGNVLINVAPTKEGTISIIEQERLVQLGDWLSINGEAIYSSVAYAVQKDVTTPTVWYTSNAARTVTYAIMTSWPSSTTVQLGSIPFTGTIQMLGTPGDLSYGLGNPGIVVTLPQQYQITSKYAWVLKLTH